MSRRGDTELVRRLQTGDGSAFAELDRRHRRALVAYARRLLRSEHDAEDVVQDALVKAHAVLADPSRPAVREIKPWLYTLVRNGAIDETRRARYGEAELPAETTDRGGGDPAMILTRKETVRRLVEDIAALPDQQRTALLLRELDGRDAAAVGEELGVSPAAAQMLVARARGALVRAREARDADCHDVREQLMLAHERGTRPAEHALRHTRGCPGCTGYRRDLRRVDRRLRALTPPLWILPAALAAKLGGGGGGKVAAGAAAATLVVAGAGIVVLDRDVVREGEATPLRLLGAGAATGQRISLGERLPAGVAVTYAKVQLPAGPVERPGERVVRLGCPGRMRAVGLAVPDRELPVRYRFAPAIDGRSRGVTVTFADSVLDEALRTRIGVVCKQPDALGSTIADPRRAGPGEKAGRLCERQTVLRSPGREFIGNVVAGDRVVVLRRSASGAWTQIETEFRLTGWVRTAALCP
ncbi:RNA polymerase sigma factor [Paraconexibacter algicola]|uniref:Sigma-70 family RNA polymerase sigma factor n=1 Tax=Paraconexibacter algicola TaxID=2133960 RepID=A0A2T4UF91_9ACTN|nr:RNA polymerase sigma factor [Paraconexibacter algicola]PTL56447.1 hypothetical protein C7Y72_15920 [Paraconexibacter algicola]